MEKHVPSLDRCKQMKELGIEFPDNMFSYVETINDDWVLRVTKDFYSEPISAPLVSELLEVMPDGVSIIKGGDFYSVFLDIDSTLRVDDINLSNALADLLIYLKDNNDL
jgi:hypothetical protein